MSLRILQTKLLIIAVVIATSYSFAPAEDNCAVISSSPQTFYFGVETPIPDSNHPYTIDTYHTDIDVSFTKLGWVIQIFHDAPHGHSEDHDQEEAIAPEDALLYAGTHARITLDSIPPGFEFIGAEPGRTFWVLPQSTGGGALPLGIAAENADESSLCFWNPNDARGANTAEKWFEVKLIDVRGPTDGHFSIWQADSMNPPVVFMSTFDGGITDKDVYYISAASHVHMNWAFTRDGLYEVDFLVTTLYNCDAQLTADLMPLGWGDCLVDFYDFAVFASHWPATDCGGEPDSCRGADLDEPADGCVGFSDLAVLANQWLECGYPGC